ncbi:ribonuclease M5 [Fervidibacillus halotolerans]|uniref:Ribonuclease M5 n=1 Tax=Fervidibacillus halotolerans TaxID=2980027 RepID=A0A9E8M2R0_9BACI|nr:ribonuclease M5 [Fervidibacillus halotolerans]WAA14000.1 ribonuclease M5 [Fervidibacillus halotolerans]
MKIKEIIVVEGKDDTVAIKRAVDADTIETNGSAINGKTIEQIRLAADLRGVIIFTDPDFPGEKIRKTISQHVPNCKHAFLPKHLAKEKNGKKIGVEHASPEHIRFALRKARKMENEPKEQISREDLINYGFIGEERSKSRRERLGEILKIGHTNGKQLYKRLKMFQISRDTFLQAVEQILQEERSNG